MVPSMSELPIPNAADSKRWLKQGPVVVANLRYKPTASGAAIDYVRLYGLKTLLLIFVPTGIMAAFVWFADSLARDDQELIIGSLTVASAVRIFAVVVTAFIVLVVGASFICGTIHGIRHRADPPPLEFRIEDGKPQLSAFGAEFIPYLNCYVVVCSLVERLWGGQPYRRWTYMHLIVENQAGREHVLSFINVNRHQWGMLRLADNQKNLEIRFLEVDEDGAIADDNHVRWLAKRWPAWRWRL